MATMTSWLEQQTTANVAKAARSNTADLRAVQQNGHAIQHLTEAQRTPEVCLAAVEQNGRAIECLTEAQRTPELCLAAVQQDGGAIYHLTEAQRTPEVCLAAVRQNGWAIRRLTDAQRTPEVCLAAVRRNGLAIQHLTEAQRTPKVCLAAVQQEGWAIHYLTEAQRTPEVCLAAVEQNGESVRYLTDPHRTPKVCLAAVRQSGGAIQYLNKAQRTPEVCLAAVQQDSRAIKHLTEAQYTHPEVAAWVESNWAECVDHLGDGKAAEVAKAILKSRIASSPSTAPDAGEGDDLCSWAHWLEREGASCQRHLQIAARLRQLDALLMRVAQSLDTNISSLCDLLEPEEGDDTSKELEDLAQLAMECRAARKVERDPVTPRSAHEQGGNGAAPPMFAYIQEGGSSTELYFHLFETQADAQDGRIDSAQGSYRTSPIFPIDRHLAEQPAFLDAMDVALRMAAPYNLEYAEEPDHVEDDPTARSAPRG